MFLLQVVLLGRFNGQGLGKDQELLLRVTKGQFFTLRHGHKLTHWVEEEHNIIIFYLNTLLLFLYATAPQAGGLVSLPGICGQAGGGGQQ